MDSQADAFASEFLLPSEALRQDLNGKTITLTLLAQLKSKWGVSMQALARQAQNLGVITEGQRKYLDKQMGLRGWIREEPVRLEPEKPRMFRKMAESTYGIPTDGARVAALASAPVKLVDEILDSHASRAELTRPPKLETIDESTPPAKRKNVLQFKPKRIRA